MIKRSPERIAQESILSKLQNLSPQSAWEDADVVLLIAHLPLLDFTIHIHPIRCGLAPGSARKPTNQGERQLMLDRQSSLAALEVNRGLLQQAL